MIDPQLRKSMQVTTAYRRASLATADAYGQPQYASLTTFKGRWDHEVKETRNADGTFAITNFVLTTETAIQPTDLLWPPGTDHTSLAQGKRPTTIIKLYDERGSVSHYEVLI